jgi:hypothetical protein
LIPFLSSQGTKGSLIEAARQQPRPGGLLGIKTRSSSKDLLGTKKNSLSRCSFRHPNKGANRSTRAPGPL